ncbi:hypothetical protein ACWCXK_22095 [Streptomyces sp. NPDC001739]
MDELERIIIEEHLCATDPQPLSTLASKLRTFQHVVHRRRSDLPQCLQDVVEEDERLRRVVTGVEQAIAWLVTEEELASRYPELTAPLAESSNLTALDLLCGLLWPGSRIDGWVFDGDIERERVKTSNALGMEPGETMAWELAARLLQEAGVRIGPEHGRLRRWLAQAGFRVTGTRVMSPLPDTDGPVGNPSPLRTGHHTVRVPNTAMAFPSQCELDHRSGTVHERSDGESLWEALARMRALCLEHGVVGDLGTLLLSAEHLPGELQLLARRVSRAYVGEDGQWHLGTGATGRPGTAVRPPVGPTVPTPTHTAPHTEPEPITASTAQTPRSRTAPAAETVTMTKAEAGRTAIMDVIEATLLEAGHPLATEDLRQRCAPTRTLTTLRRELEADRRFYRSDLDMWALPDWGMPVYKPLRELVADMVDEAGGAVPSYEVIKRLTRNFSIKESSVRQAISSTPFTSRGGLVRRLDDMAAEQARWQQTTITAAAGTTGEVPSAVELMKEMGLDF